MKNNNDSENNQNEPGTTDLSWSEELGSRINSVAKQFGGRENAASVAGVTAEMLGRYVSGKTQKIPLAAIARMCEAQNVSLDWVWYGDDLIEKNLDLQGESVVYEVKTLDDVANLGRKFADALKCRSNEEQKAILTALWGSNVANEIVVDKTKYPEIKRHLAGSVKKPRRGTAAKIHKTGND